jgi:oxygen-independent coproporphyrinogen-3 oxidase
MLRLRLREGLPLAGLTARAAAVAHRAVADDLIDPTGYSEGVMRLTLRGRLLADALVRDLVE